MFFKFRSKARAAALGLPLQQWAQTYWRRKADRAFLKKKNAAGLAALIRLSRYPDPEVFFRLGECYEKGIGAIRNFPYAVRFFEASATRGKVEAMVKLGEIYLSGRLAPSSPSGGDPSKQPCPEERRQRWRLSNVVPRDFEKAMFWNLRAAEAGSPEAQARLGFQYVTAAGTARDVFKAKEWFSAAAAQGAAAGQLGLGILLANGALGPPELDAAAVWFEKAAQLGNQQAKIALAQLLSHRLPVGFESRRFIGLLRELADSGHTWSMYKLGALYQDGAGIEQDLELAETYLRRACSRQYLSAFLPLASLLSKQHVMRDEEAAATVLRQGADVGDPRSQFALSEIYALGQGVPLDLTESASWFKKASSHGRSVLRNN